MKLLSQIRNLYKPGVRQEVANLGTDYVYTQLAGQQPNKNSPVYILPRLQFERIRVDMQVWRSAIVEAENAFNPQRVLMQRIFQDTDLNEQVTACVRRRKNLTLLRKFKICDEEGNENKEVTALFKTMWFRNFQSYCLDALFYGYNLISLGDIEDDAFPNVSFVRRQNISPDRLVVKQFVYSIGGTRFDLPPFDDWYIFITTPTETGVSQCGYGLYYKIAKTEILIRNNTAQNADYNEVFGQPIRVGKTSKQNDERDQFEDALRTMGSNPYMILDDGVDSVELIQSSGSGTAYATYENFEMRCEKKIAKVILGHEDGLNSTPGLFGSNQGGEDSPISDALNGIQSEDSGFLEPLINNQLIPRMKKLGFNIPDGLHFEYLNDEEKEAFRRRQDESNAQTATLFKTIKDAGGDLDEESWKYFEDRTGIPVKMSVPPEPPAGFGLNGGIAPKQNGVPTPSKNGKQPVVVKK